MRFTATVLLWLLTTAALAVAVPAAWTQKNIIDADGYAAMAEKSANDPALRAAVASELATRAMALIKQRGYTADPAEVHAVAAAYTASPSFPPHFADANRLVHSWMFAGTGAQSEDHQLVINVAPMLNDPVFDPLLIRLDVAVPADVTVPVAVSTPKVLQPGKLRPLATWGLWMGIVVAALTGVCALLTLATARSRGRGLAGLGVSALLVGAAGWAAIEVARRRINDALNYTTGDTRRIAEVMVGEAENSLHHWLNLTLVAGGVLVVFGVFVALLGGLRKR
ncbi:MAG: hypothetical protein J2P17_08140 [Mycobacterium sp.]|nr:hypothetical protein [Mycobacterium sp.]